MPTLPATPRNAARTKKLAKAQTPLARLRSEDSGKTVKTILLGRKSPGRWVKIERDLTVIRLCNRPETRPEAGGARRLGVVGLVISAVHSEALMNQVRRHPGVERPRLARP